MNLTGDCGLAPLWGTKVLFRRLNNKQVLLMKENCEEFVTSTETFEYMYHELNEHIAALKEDCIQYVVHRRYQPLHDYPQWYVRAVVDSYIFEDGLGYGGWMFYDEAGELAISEGSYILRNYKGDLKLMERSEFVKYYEEIGGF